MFSKVRINRRTSKQQKTFAAIVELVTENSVLRTYGSSYQINLWHFNEVGEQAFSQVWYLMFISYNHPFA
jgi:hypothetical protein